MIEMRKDLEEKLKRYREVVTELQNQKTSG